MKISYIKLIIGFLGVAALLVPKQSVAAWPLNTPDQQWNALWAGETLVWNDNRLGSIDIFMRDHKGVVTPLISGGINRHLVAASAQTVVFTEAQDGLLALISYDLATHSVRTIQKSSVFERVSAWQNDIAWTDGNIWYLYTSGQTFSSATPPDARVTALGLTWLEAGILHGWDGHTEQTFHCSGCSTFAAMGNQVVSQTPSNVLLLPSNISINVSGVEAMSASDDSLLLWQGDKSFIWRSDKIIQTPSLIDKRAHLGAHGLMYESMNDIQLTQDLVPTVSDIKLSGDQEKTRLSGASSGVSVEIQATGLHAHYRKTITVLNGQWDTRVFDDSAPEDTYTITAVAISLFDQKSTTHNLGTVVIDHTPPQFVSPPTVTSTINAAEIKFETNEKTTSHVVLTSADDTNVHRSNRLTFKHTIDSSDLDADTDYDVLIEARDAVSNLVKYLMRFKTQSLLSASVSVQSFASSAKNGIWEGFVLVEPGVIDDQEIIVYHPSITQDELYPECKCVLLDWTIGKPPPLKRGDHIRFLASWNKARTVLLLHRSKAAALIERGNEPRIHSVERLEDAQPYQWISITGELTSVTKTSWKIRQNDRELSVHWEHQPTFVAKRHDIVTITGFLYVEHEKLLLAALSSVLIESGRESDQPTTSVDEEVLAVKTIHPSSPVVRLASASVSPVQPLRQMFIEDNVTNGYDKSDNLWYNLVLILSAGVTVARFFFFSSQ